MERECVIRGTLALVLRLGRVMGVAPLRFKSIENGYRVSISYYMKIYSYLLITILNISLLCALCLDIQKRAIRTKTMTNLAFLMPDMITAFLTSSFGAYYGVHRMKIMMKHLNLLEQVKRNIGNKDIRLTPKRTISVIIYLVAAFACLFTFGYDLVSNYYSKEKFLTILYCVYLWLYVAMFLWEIQAILLILEVHSVLLAVNNKMDQMISSEYPMTISTMRYDVRALSQAYITVCEVASDMNRVNGGIIFIIFINFIVTSIMTFYYGFFLYYVLSPFYLSTQQTWCIIYVIMIIAFLESSHSIKMQEIQIKVRLSKLLSKFTRIGNRIPTEMELMFKNIFLNKPVYSPMGVFTLHRSLITTITSAFITYMLFMVQLKL